MVTRSVIIKVKTNTSHDHAHKLGTGDTFLTCNMGEIGEMLLKTNIAMPW